MTRLDMRGKAAESCNTSRSMTLHGSGFGSISNRFSALWNALGSTITVQLNDLLTLWSSIGCMIGVKVFTYTTGQLCYHLPLFCDTICTDHSPYSFTGTHSL